MQAVDGLRSTFWASKFEPAEPVTLTVDLGSPQSLTEIVLDWEFPAKSFSIATSSDGSTWKVVSSTDANVLLKSSVAVSGVVASKVRITMTETSPDTGFFKGKALYGLVDVAIFGAGLTPIVEECTKAASTSDARDKYFLASVSEITRQCSLRPAASRQPWRLPKRLCRAPSWLCKKACPRAFLLLLLC